MSSPSLSASGHSPSSTATAGRRRGAAGPLIGYALAGAGSLLVWTAVLSLGLLILR